jgi:signal transduction histidine kinase
LFFCWYDGDVGPQVDEADRIQRLEAQLHVLSGALRAFAEATTDYEHLLSMVARTLGGTDGCVVRLLSDGGWLSPVAIHLPLEPHIRDADALARIRAHVAAAHNVAEHAGLRSVIETGAAVVVPRVDIEQLWSAATPEMVRVYETIGIHSMLLVALRARGESIGTLAVFRFDPASPPFDEHDRGMAQALADHSALAISNARLLQAATRELAERERAAEQIRYADRLATVGKLAAGVAHEIGTPLSVVAGHAQMIAGREVTGDKAIESARIIDAQVDRVAGIVRHLLDFARRKGPEGGSVEVLAVATGTVKLLQPSAREKGVTVRVAGHVAEAQIDAKSLEQVVTNLLVNALQASRDGGEATVTVERMLVTAPDRTTEGSFVRIEVRDTGTGISDDVRPYIFEPFFTTKPTGDGPGLGLSVVHGIVQDHLGWITVDTAMGRGTTVSVFLPCGRPQR